MKHTQEITNLINRCFDANGFLINPNSRKNQKEARQILNSDDYRCETDLDYNQHDSLLIIAYPNKDI
jgi:hypothetical protein